MAGHDGFVMLVGLAGAYLWPLAFMMTKISYSGYRFPPVISNTRRDSALMGFR
jgi:hypothetical protein